MTEAEEIICRLRKSCRGEGLEFYPFKIQWYNDRVQPAFHLNYDPNTLAVLLVSCPAMFERLFIPYLFSPDNSPSQLDPLDQCIRNKMTQLKEQTFSQFSVDMFQDFELHPLSRRPKVLVQTAGHVAGAARYYQRSDVVPDPWEEKEKIYGVSVHPKFGGWFALRGVLIFKNVLAPELVQVEPFDCVPTRELKIELLEKFNRCWQNWSYRDVIAGQVQERYSAQQREYFGRAPALRSELIDALRLSHQQGSCKLDSVASCLD